MMYAIVESGGKQYKAVAGEALEVDRLPLEVGAKFDFESVLLVVDGDEVMVGAPTVAGVPVKATVLEHFKGQKLIVFKYTPKKRIRVKRGHRQQYTRLMIDQVGKTTAAEKAAKAAPVEEEATVKKEAAAKKPAKAAAASKTAKKAAAKKTPAKKTASKKAPAKKMPAKKTASAKKTSSTAKKSSAKKS
ncbi:MAG: 50S ribosomal protein L21 [Anaerolineales bacterium]|nr:50S ribosomal protein L21 [Anaerolineales bacterium]